ncbi:MAG: hypothetical protein ACRBN8_05015 [Nannocystales bacterium]
MNTFLRVRGLLVLATLLGSGGCIIVDDSDDDDSGTTGAGTSGATSGTSGSESTSDGAAESGSSGAALDCSRCDADAEPDVLCHSSYDAAADLCVCDAGFEFSGNDFECVPVEGTGGSDCGTDPNIMVAADGSCVCVEGWNFCTTDPDDFSCCEA